MNITKPKFSKWRLAVLWPEVTDEKISEQIQPQKTKILKQLFASCSVIIREYSPRLRLGEYSPIIT
jgi:hypothetical protein